MTIHNVPLPPRQQWTALIVDDERDNLAVASMGLKFHEIKTYTASSGKEALVILKTLTPTFILLDLDMPAMSGYEVLKEIRQQTRLEMAVVFCMTANQIDKRTDILERGFDAYLEKPFSIHDLAKKIEEQVEQFYRRYNLGVYD